MGDLGVWQDLVFVAAAILVFAGVCLLESLSK
jgi:hypothetical protein